MAIKQGNPKDKPLNIFGYDVKIVKSITPRDGDITQRIAFGDGRIEPIAIMMESSLYPKKGKKK